MKATQIATVTDDAPSPPLSLEHRSSLLRLERLERLERRTLAVTKVLGFNRKWQNAHYHATM